MSISANIYNLLGASSGPTAWQRVEAGRINTVQPMQMELLLAALALGDR